MTHLNIDTLIASLPPGENVFLSGSAGEPSTLSEYLATHPEAAPGVNFHCSFIPGVNSHNLAVPGHRTMAVSFMQGGYYKDYINGDVRFHPGAYSTTQLRLARPGQIDTLLLQVSPPDENGQCSLGPHSEFIPGILGNKPKILAVINSNTPALPGASSIPFAAISAYFEDDSELPTYDAGKLNTVSEKIANNIAGLIPDGAALQCGLGKIPNQLMLALSSHKGLRIHSGMISDSIAVLLENQALAEDAPITTIAALGSREFYRLLPDIPRLEIVGVEHCHSPNILASIPKLFAVNSALEVDLSGQVNAETINGKPVSGPGGLPDFAAAASRDPEGLSIIALPATDPSGEISRIVAQLPQGSRVTVPQYHVDVVVTEYGSALLREADLKTRAKRLIDIAAPEHREQLQQQFEHHLKR
ncbi:acetyl-CoA hydrolase/transferase family protein [Spongiibacter sp. UBA1325]|jgi:acyl-CoA hydrolase|uniref:acetyl-CoA hydrolase/transferase family protein n=1 Tax=Spongiibacter sp. UBA1325 TaxID=1947543 RepID=UPI00257FDC47|nr:acetyl-CoA hydrolase/transferase C-terminal domain-containing protein [Spongiibacter sp. UBA1325]|tara:strand:- start:2138 stop:3385 length:1248 start_codon:yes stop_codon:yes gene_type:complete